MTTMTTTTLLHPEMTRPELESALLGGATPREVAAECDLDHDADADAVILRGWYVADEGGEAGPIETLDGDYVLDAIDAAHAAVEGWCDAAATTAWHTVRVHRLAIRAEGGAIVEERVGVRSVRVTIHPDEPDCQHRDDHDWAVVPDGVRGHGGGVIVTEVCRHCRACRVTDTWAQDPHDGAQGLLSLAYRGEGDPCG